MSAGVSHRLQLGWRRAVPMIGQGEIAECGLACLAMISGYHGLQLDMPAIRQRVGAVAQGMNMADLLRAAQGCGLQGRALRLEPADLKQLRLPAILHWQMSHFVVLTRCHRGGVEINDPAMGVRTIRHAELDRCFTGIALELQPNASFKREDLRQKIGLASLCSGFRDWPKRLAQLAIFGLLLQSCALALPLLMQVILDQVLPSGEAGLLPALAIGFCALVMFRSLAEFSRGWLLVSLGASLNLYLSQNVVRRLFAIKPEWFISRRVGDVQSRVQALMPINEALTSRLPEFMVDGAVAVFALLLMFSYGWQLTGIALAAIASYAALRLICLRLHRDALQASVVRAAGREAHLLESLRAMITVKANGREPLRFNQWLNLHVETVNQETRVARLRLAERCIQGLLAGVEYVALAVVGARLILSGGITVGMLIAFMAFRQMFSQSAVALASVLIDWRLLNVHLDRLSDVVLAPTEAESGHTWPFPVQGRLRARGLGLRWSQDREFVFRDVDLDIAPGSFVAITGPSGCGKSSLLKLLMGLVEPTEGEVLVDQYQLSAVGAPAFRGICAAVMQDDKLLGGTLIDNLTLFDPNPDIDRVRQCLEWAAIADEVRQLPMGLHTPLGDMGTILSGGQQQRLLLARALYRQPQFLFLDEATSALDAATERRVCQHLARLGITRIAVAHREESLRHADRVIELSQHCTLASSPASAAA